MPAMGTWHVSRGRIGRREFTPFHVIREPVPTDHPDNDATQLAIPHQDDAE
jgi:hypothetical protein